MPLPRLLVDPFIMRTNIDAFKKAFAAQAAGKTVTKDSDDFYQLSVDKNGSGSAIIRFLQPIDGEDPFVTLFNHAFQGASGKWFIENCPSTLKLACPVCESNSQLWNTDKALASLRKRKKYYISNILVVADPKMPENIGKVCGYKFGEKVMSKINDVISPVFPDVEPMDPFDPDAGANFRLRVTKSGSFPDYDKSSFDPPSSMGDEATVAKILSQRRSLAAIIAPDQFKSYDDLKKKFDQIVGLAETA